EHGIRHQTLTSIPASIGFRNINRSRTSNPLRVYRRQRRRIQPQTVTSASSPSTTTVATSSRHNSLQSKLPPPPPLSQPLSPPLSPSPIPSSLTARDHSRESLVSLYCLFQDNTTSSKTSHI
ncbi:unnamed protein product, partial [Rotaria magnacalcarata]